MPNKIKNKLGINLKSEKALANINNFFNWRNNAIKFVDDYWSMTLEAEKRAAEGEESKSEQEPSKEKSKGKKSLLKLPE